MIFSLQKNIIDKDISIFGASIYSNISYSLPTINLCFGTLSKQCFDLALSLTSPFIFIESSQSDYKSLRKQFNETLSSSFEYPIKKDFISFPMLDSYFVIGYTGYDFIYFPNELSPPNEKMIFLRTQITKKMTKFNLDGSIGLQMLYNNYSISYREEFSFVKYLKDTYRITKQNFALKYKSDGSGIFTIGEDYGEDYPKCINNLPSSDNHFWTCYVSSLSFGNETIDQRGKLATFNSINNIIVAPYLSGEMIAKQIIRLAGSNQCQKIKDFDYYSLICTIDTDINNLPHLYLRMNEAVLILKWKNLFRIVKYDSTEVYLSLLALDNMNNHYQWKIGIPGFIDNMIIFNRDDMSIGIFPPSFANENNHLLILSFYIINIILVIIGIGFLLLIKYFLIH